MRSADHAYVRNGLGAVNENGHVPCAICGRVREGHAAEAIPVVHNSSSPHHEASDSASYRQEGSA